MDAELPEEARELVRHGSWRDTEEIIDARVWGGIHFRTADMQGAVLGKKVGHFM